MAPSTSAREPKAHPSERLAFRPATSRLSGPWCSRCASSLCDVSGNFAVRASGAGAPGATLDDIEEHQKWVAEWSERVQSAAERGPVPLGRVSERAAALLGGDPQAPDNLFAGTPAGDGIERDAAVPQ